MRTLITRLSALLALCAVGTMVGGLLPTYAEGVIERVARSGRLRLVGPVDQPPLMLLDRNGVAQGYGVVVAERVAAMLSQAVGRPVAIQFQPLLDGPRLAQQLTGGGAELACGIPFSWTLDEILDFSVPIAISGIRVMAPAGRFSGNPEEFKGRPIAVVRGGLGESVLRGVQPGSRIVPFPNLSAALNALTTKQVDAVVGDSLLLRGRAQELGLVGMALTPKQPYERYALVCAVPENASAFRNLVNRAIVQLQQGYLDNDPTSVNLVNRWLGPGSAANLPPEMLRNLFDALLMGVEPIRPLTPGSP